MQRMKKFTFLTVLLIISSFAQISYGMATEQVGPDSLNRYPTIVQPDWPNGIVEIPRHESRVYSIWVNGNENFYFKCTVDEINELLAIFAKARMRDHVVRIEPGIKKATTFAKDEIEYNVQLQIVGGIVLSFAREEMRDDLPLEPRLTIITGDDGAAFINRLKWPANVIVESQIPDVSINSNNIKVKRDVYYGLCEFADGSPPVEFVKGINSRITLWEENEPNGIGIGRIDNKGYCMLLLSDAELADLKDGKTWLTITIGNWLVKESKTDTRFPVEMLTKNKEQAKPIKVAAPSYYYGRILFEDGSPPVLDPPPWPGAKIMVHFPYCGSGDFDSQGYFKVSLTKEQFIELNLRKAGQNIYIPDLVKRGRSTAKFVYPPNLLSQDKSKAGIIRIPRPKPPRQELTTAESKIGKPIPGFDKILFEISPDNQIKGKPLLICFWDIDQRSSRQYIRDLEEQKEALQEKNIAILIVYSGTRQKKEVEQWLKKSHISLEAGIIEGDPYDTLLAWGARALPWFVLTDDKHIITNEGFSINELPSLK